MGCIDVRFLTGKLQRMHTWLLLGALLAACSAKTTGALPGNTTDSAGGARQSSGASNTPSGGSSGTTCTATVQLGSPPNLSWDASSAPPCKWPDVFNADAGGTARAARAAVDCKLVGGVTFGDIFSDSIPAPGECCADVCSDNEYAVSGVMSSPSPLDACRLIPRMEFDLYCCPCE